MDLSRPHSSQARCRRWYFLVQEPTQRLWSKLVDLSGTDGRIYLLDLGLYDMDSRSDHLPQCFHHAYVNGADCVMLGVVQYHEPVSKEDLWSAQVAGMSLFHAIRCHVPVECFHYRPMRHSGHCRSVVRDMRLVLCPVHFASVRNGSVLDLEYTEDRLPSSFYRTRVESLTRPARTSGVRRVTRMEVTRSDGQTDSHADVAVNLSSTTDRSFASILGNWFGFWRRGAGGDGVPVGTSVSV